MKNACQNGPESVSFGVSTRSPTKRIARIRLGGLHSRPVTAPGAPPKRTPWSVVHGHGGVYSVCSLLVERTRVSRPCSLVRKVRSLPPWHWTPERLSCRTAEVAVCAKVSIFATTSLEHLKGAKQTAWEGPQHRIVHTVTSNCRLTWKWMAPGVSRGK